MRSSPGRSAPSVAPSWYPSDFEGVLQVLNKYYPPDFDPAKLPRGKRPDHNSMKVRMMLPMSVQCKTCGTFMYKGTKFNMKKEDVDGDTYLGIQIFRFYWRCSACAAEITMKTDPKNADYNMELGATRNYEPWREKDKAVALSKAQREEEERGNAMKVCVNELAWLQCMVLTGAH